MRLIFLTILGSLISSLSFASSDYYLRTDLLGKSRFVSNGKFYSSAPFGQGDYTGYSHFFGLGKKFEFGDIEIVYGSYDLTSGYSGDPHHYDRMTQLGVNYYYEINKNVLIGGGIHYFLTSEKRFISSNRIAPSFSCLGQVSVYKELFKLYINGTIYGYFGHANQLMTTFSIGVKVGF